MNFEISKIDCIYVFFRERSEIEQWNTRVEEMARVIREEKEEGTILLHLSLVVIATFVSIRKA